MFFIWKNRFFLSFRFLRLWIGQSHLLLRRRRQVTRQTCILTATEPKDQRHTTKALFPVSSPSPPWLQPPRLNNNECEGVWLREGRIPFPPPSEEGPPAHAWGGREGGRRKLKQRPFCLELRSRRRKRKKVLFLLFCFLVSRLEVTQVREIGTEKGLNRDSPSYWNTDKMLVKLSFIPFIYSLRIHENIAPIFLSDIVFPHLCAIKKVEEKMVESRLRWNRLCPSSPVLFLLLSCIERGGREGRWRFHFWDRGEEENWKRKGRWPRGPERRKKIYQLTKGKP